MAQDTFVMTEGLPNQAFKVQCWTARDFSFCHILHLRAPNDSQNNNRAVE